MSELDELNELYNFWFSNTDLWFRSKPEDDDNIVKKYEQLMNIFANDLKKINSLMETKHKIAIIVLLDQIPRHIIRSKDKGKEYNENFVNDLNKIIVEFVEKNYFDLVNKINANEFSFVMLPIRHSRNFEKIKWVLKESWNILSNNTNNVDVLQIKRFLKATYENIIKQIDFIPFNNNIDNNFEILDNKQIIEKYKDILDEMIIKNHDHCSGTGTQQIEKSIKQLQKDNKTYILSLSGGVDSLSLSHLMKKHKYNFICVFINYNNRDCSMREEEFLIDWCKFLDVKLYVRRIDEIHRPTCMDHDMRDIYENYTRDIRYSAYVNAAKINGFSEINVIMGHNRDDCFENIITNLVDKSKYDNLLGMQFISAIKNISFIRPMLDVNKQDIYNYALINNLPFLFDSTPNWSRRGKIRDIIKPTLTNWEAESINSFFVLADTMSELTHANEFIVNSYIKKMELYDKTSHNIKQINEIKCDSINYTIVDIDELISINTKIFWITFLNKLNVYCTRNSIIELVARIVRIKNNYHKLDVNNVETYRICATCDIIFNKMSDDKILFAVVRK